MRWPRGNSFGAFTLGALGLLLWLVAQFIAIGLAGGGHGWNSPAIISLPLVLVYPATLICVFHPSRIAMKLGIAFVIIALVLDGFLLWKLFSEEYAYFPKVSASRASDLLFVFVPLVAVWLVLWVGWQALILGMLQQNFGGGAQVKVAGPQSRMGGSDVLLMALVLTGTIGIAYYLILFILDWFGWMP